MEVILKNELSKKIKKQNESTYIYETYDFDAIQERIDNLEYIVDKTKKESDGYIIDSNQFKECEFRIKKFEQELKFNMVHLKRAIDSLC